MLRPPANRSVPGTACVLALLVLRLTSAAMASPDWPSPVVDRRMAWMSAIPPWWVVRGGSGRAAGPVCESAEGG